MITPAEFGEVAQHYAGLKIAVIGDFCLDRYLEIDPARSELSIETGLEVYNVTNVRSQPGGAGTILNNLVALGVGKIFAAGFCGEDGEGYELLRSLGSRKGVDLSCFLQTRERKTFTYTKPLVVQDGTAPRELNRLDIKNWTATPRSVEDELARRAKELLESVDAVILLDQVEIPNTGVVTEKLLASLHPHFEAGPEKLVIADSRRSLKNFPPVSLKMNRAELGLLTGLPASSSVAETQAQAKQLASTHRRDVFVTLSEDGVVGARPTGEVVHVPANPVRGEIDIVGAGDSVTANLAASLAAGAQFTQAMEIAMAASSIVIHQLGTTGSASPQQISDLLTKQNDSQ